MKGKEKILANSVSGVLILEICFYGNHGVCIFNHSHILPTAEKFANEERQKIKNGKDIKWKYSWREHLENTKSDLAKNYHRFNLTESDVTAYVRVDDYVLSCYNTPKVLEKLGVEEISKKHLAKHLLTMWIENTGLRIGLND